MRKKLYFLTTEVKYYDFINTIVNAIIHCIGGG